MPPNPVPPAAETDVTAMLAEAWQAAGVRRGDCLLLHSSLLRLFTLYRRQGITLGVDTVLDSFLHALGEAGTLLLPTFNFGFTRGETFDIRNTPSEMGALTEAARKHPLALRTRHPIYAFAAIGEQAERFAALENVDSFGADSPFSLLRELGGKIAVLGLPDQGSMTSYHHVEHMADVDYRYHKTFTAPYTDADGITTTRDYRMHVRDIVRGVITAVEPMGDILWAEGLYAGERFNVGHGLRSIPAQVFFERCLREIHAGHAEGLLYRIAKAEDKHG